MLKQIDIRTVVLTGIVVGVGAVGAVVFGGVYDVAATKGHIRPIELVLRTTMERSVERQARAVRLPTNVDLTDRAYASRFFGHYDAACATCHGAPGRAPDPWMVIYPSAPNLTQARVVARWSDRELFWLLKHGVKDTGMMALGPTHGDDDIWGVTAFVRQLPAMTAEEYAELANAQVRALAAAAHEHH